MVNQKPFSASPFWSRFYSQLPNGIYLMGRICRIEPSGDGDFELLIENSYNSQAVATAIDGFAIATWNLSMKGRKPLSTKDYEIPVSSPRYLADFLRFFLCQPIGPRFLTFDLMKGFRSYSDRLTVINRTYLTWYALTHASKHDDGHLKWPIPCSGYFPGNRSLCRAGVFDFSGCCPRHRIRWTPLSRPENGFN